MIDSGVFYLDDAVGCLSVLAASVTECHVIVTDSSIKSCGESYWAPYRCVLDPIDALSHGCAPFTLRAPLTLRRRFVLTCVAFPISLSKLRFDYRL